MTTGAMAEVESPFFTGMEARLANDANAAGRLLVTQGGMVRARVAGVVAWAARSSGHTFGDGAQTANDAARTEPMIHVTSSGAVTIGRSVMDAFIRGRIAGADETLSAAENTVLSAVTAGDSDALNTALDALPDAYDDEYKARARNLLDKRGAAAPTSATALAHQAAEEILGLARAGVRAMALSHTALADHVRNGDRDPTILSTPEATRTEEQQATLAEQEKLSADERTVLEAALTGGDLEAALDALPAAYTDTWKDGVRQRAASYNAGDIQVDVTGGSIVAEGNGVEALYAIPHDRNGGIVVSVAEDARVTGGGKGIYVRSAGETTAGVRNQTVTVDGAAMGGTGAGVHLVGGGTVTVDANGEVGATSGVGILADGSGDLTATVSGTVTGDIRVDGDGDLTANVMAGGVVTGTIHDPQASFTVGSGASIGRILYASGGTVTVSGGGKLTGVEGVAAESTAGALAVTVNDEGRVEGDIKSGGTLMATVDAGGVVTGTIEDPQASFTVAGSVGRVLYASGGTVTVAATGALTGVEVEGRTEALRSEAGDLALTVAGMGRVTGDVRALGDGDLSATVSGTVDGDLRAEGGGALTLNLMQGGTVTGTVHDPASSLTVAGTIGRLLYTNGATVTVAATGKLTGVEVEGRTEALRSEAGDLALTVAGMGRVTGDVRALGDGNLTATVDGTLTGDVIEEGDGDLSATVSGTVDGDLRAEGGGALTLNLMQGGTVTGTVHDPASPLTVAGTIGRLLYTNGATVTVAATGALTGVEAEGRTEALRSEAGDLDLTVAGTVTGDVFGLGAGEHTVTVANGGTVTGTVHLAASTVRVDGTAGRVRFDQGGTVTVGTTGRLTGIEVDDRTEAIRNAAGELVVSVAGGGRITGDIIDLGARPARVTTEPGSRVAGTIDVAGEGSEVRVGGTAGRVLFDQGGTVTVGTTGSLMGIEVDGRTEAIRNAAGDLMVSVAGRVGGDIEVAGARSVVRVDGTVEGGIQFRRGGMVTVGPDGKVEGEVSSDEGELVAVVVLKPEETEDRAWERAFPGDVVEKGGKPTLLTQPKEGGPTYPRGMVPEEADAPVYEARWRVYEALPSVVLGLNGLPGFRERMAAPRSAQGGWARVEALRGKWKAEASTSGKESGVGLEHRHRRHGIQVGLAGALGEEALLGVSLHHRRGSAEVSEGGDLELSGTGAGVSGTWVREEVYVDVQAAMTGYEADLTSSRRGVLKKDVSGHGHALGVEAGRRLALERLPAGVVLTPRAGLVHSRVSVDAFSDAMDSRVTVDGARSLKGRVGVDAEVTLGGAPGSRVFASVEVEHEFSTDRKVRVSGRELRSEADATWLRLGLDGAHTWEDGRYTLQGGMGYATSGGSYEFGGGLSLMVQF